MLDTAKQAGDIIEATVFERLTRLQHPSNLRPFDVIGDGEISDTILPLARAVDVFVALPRNGRSNEPQGLIDSPLFGTGRHLFLVPDDQRAMVPFENVVAAWNGSRESARAISESLPYLRQASKVGILVIEIESKTQADPLKGDDAVLQLRHHGINAVKSPKKTRLPKR
ncbi:hypothetical protein [Bradyrhizobium erythrophlei]|uniref:hypothetical protein n=1 Tax=Bradyrhizobium erythrophlei TaxID=1437360 RepID=UPI000B8097B7|nr:hypothetical protein [Bradyrhizobium erythrophlei]